MEKDEGKIRSEWKNWRLWRKIKMRGGNITGRHESEGWRERGVREEVGYPESGEGGRAQAESHSLLDISGSAR